MRYLIDKEIAEKDPGYGSTNTAFFDESPLPHLIKEEIIKNGPMRFDQYWSMSQYSPKFGAYNKIRHFKGFYESEGASMKSTDYAIAMAQYVIENSKDENKIRVIECGAGTGDFMLRFLIAMKHMSHLSIEVYIVETSESLILTQQYKLKCVDIKWVNDIFDIPNNDIKTFVLCEMVLDSFPHRGFIKKDDQLYELYINEKGALVEKECDEHFDISNWKDGIPVFRSMPAEQFFLKIMEHFKRCMMISVDHCLESFSSKNSQLHLVTPYEKPTNFIKNAGYFLIACSLYIPFYLEALKGVNFSFQKAKTFFYNIGDYHVYEDDPRFYVLLIKNNAMI